MKMAVIIPAAGLGKRFGQQGGLTKIEMDLAGKPVFLWAVQRFVNRPEVGQVILAVHPERKDEFEFRYGDKLGFLGVKIIAGGERERWETVLKAMEAVAADCTHIAVHDAARPMPSESLISRVFEAAQRYAAVLPGMAVANTLKRVQVVQEAKAVADVADAILGGPASAGGEVKRIVATVDRASLVGVQTPQVFEAELLRRAYEPLAKGTHGGAGVTDDAGLVEAIGEPVYVVEGESTNFKITTPLDAELAGAWMEKQAAAKAKRGARRIFADADDDEF